MDLAPRPSTAAAPVATTATSPPETPEIPSLDPDAIAATRTLIGDDPRFGRLVDVVVWAAGAQAVCPPRPFRAPVVLLLGAGEVVSDDSLPERRLAATGDTPAASAVGAAAVDAEVDGGADLLLVGGSGRRPDAAAAVVSVLTGREPVACVRRGGDTAAWSASVTAVRDARRRGKPYAADPFSLLAEIGDAELALLTGVLMQAARRRTPVLLEGLVASAAGLLAEAVAPGSSLWWALGSSDGDPAAAFAAGALELDPLLDLGLGFPALSGSRLALPVLQAALGAVPDSGVPADQSATATGNPDADPGPGPGPDPGPGDTGTATGDAGLEPTAADGTGDAGTDAPAGPENVREAPAHPDRGRDPGPAAAAPSGEPPSASRA